MNADDHERRNIERAETADWLLRMDSRLQNLQAALEDAKEERDAAESKALALKEEIIKLKAEIFRRCKPT
jgi:hypothetical protein